MQPVTVITGTTHGIGRETAAGLARAGHTVVMLCRDPAAAGRVRAEIAAQVAGADLRVVPCDLASLAAVHTAAAAVRREVPRIDRLLNNAGIVSTRFRRSVDGFELTFATNHLGPFLLTHLLLDHLAPGARVINVASRAHRGATLDLAAVVDPRPRYRPTVAYARSKFANVLHAFALARRLAARGIVANCLHPGVVATHLLPRWLRVVKPWVSHTIDAAAGARSSLRLATDPAFDRVSGAYFDERPVQVPADPRAGDLALQEALWTASERWCGIG